MLSTVEPDSYAFHGRGTMNTVARWAIALALSAGPMAAESQTYNLDITMTGVSTFDGSFTF
jgi:hypothetical protein